MNEWNIKNKKTGEYFTVISKCSNDTWKIIGGNGIVKELKAKTIESEYETTEVDYNQFAKSLCEQFKSNKYLREIGDVMARRTTSGYYEVGKLVYFPNPTFCENKDHRGYGCYYGPEAIYQIDNIVSDNDQPGLWWVYINRWRGKEKKKDEGFDRYKDPEFKLPMYIDILMPGDVYNEVKRFDMPF